MDKNYEKTIVIHKRLDGSKYIRRILPYMNSVCPICRKKLPITKLKRHLDFAFSKSKKYRRFNSDWLKKERDSIDVTIDHIIPISEGGTNDTNNLQLVHYKCNQLKSSHTQYKLF